MEEGTLLFWSSARGAASPLDCPPGTFASASGLRSDALSGFTFGPVVPHGAGFGYLLTPDGVTLNVTSWEGQGPPAAALAAETIDALRRLQALLDEHPPPPRSKL